MKPLSLLGLTLLFLAPISLRADPAPLTAVSTGNPRQRTTRLTVRNPHAAPSVYYITRTTVTGSHIPVVYRRYRGRTTPIEGGFRRDDVFGAGAIGATGATDVSTALRMLEPSIR